MEFIIIAVVMITVSLIVSSWSNRVEERSNLIEKLKHKKWNS